MDPVPIIEFLVLSRIKMDLKKASEKSSSIRLKPKIIMGLPKPDFLSITDLPLKRIFTKVPTTYSWSWKLFAKKIEMI